MPHMHDSDEEKLGCYCGLCGTYHGAQFDCPDESYDDDEEDFEPNPEPVTFGTVTTNWLIKPTMGAAYRLVDGTLYYAPLLDGFPEQGGDLEVMIHNLDPEVKAKVLRIGLALQHGKAAW